MKLTAAHHKELQPRIRVLWSKDIAVGPGKAELLARLQATGSISEAAQRMGMSYMRAWTLLQTMNRCFKEPLVSAIRGGTRGGGSELTPTGKRVLALYRQSERQTLRATQATWKKLSKLMRD